METMEDEAPGEVPAIFASIGRLGKETLNMIFFVGGTIYLAIYLWRYFVSSPRVDRGDRRPHARLLVVLGSGGHTTEMITLLGALDLRKYAPRCYVLADTDNMSRERVVRVAEARYSADAQSSTTVSFRVVRRSREVGQSWITTAWTTGVALAHSFRVVADFRPDVVLCNGPGTCIPICAWALVFKYLGRRPVKIIFVESICRVKSLSLTGRLLYRLADRFVVQWDSLAKLYPRAEYWGRLS
eukprot:tig00001038_g6535.t1